MKAFVIKNKEGLYYTTHLNYEDIHTEDISEANIFNKEIANGIKLFLNKTTCEKWKVVGITIEEGDLEQQLAIYKRALELACEKYIKVDGISYIIRNNSKDDEDYFNKIKQIQKETIDYFLHQAKKKLEEEECVK